MMWGFFLLISAYVNDNNFSITVNTLLQVHEIEKPIENEHYLSEKGPEIDPNADTVSDKNLTKKSQSDPNMIFQCQQCESHFKSRCALRDHVNSVHEAIIYRCLICFVETYKAKKSVKRHLLQIHQIDR